MKELISPKQWVDPKICVQEGERQWCFHLQECFNFHGYDAVGGVVLGFRLLQAAQRYLNQGQPFQRRQLSLYTAFPGLGAKDVFELISRMCSDQRYELNEHHHHPAAAKGVAGSFYFKFGYQGKSVQLSLIDGAPGREFIETGKASKQPDADAAVHARWTALKIDLANTLLRHPENKIIRRL